MLENPIFLLSSSDKAAKSLDIFDDGRALRYVQCTTRRLFGLREHENDGMTEPTRMLLEPNGASISHAVVVEKEMGRTKTTISPSVT